MILVKVDDNHYLNPDRIESVTERGGYGVRTTCHVGMRSGDVIQIDCTARDLFRIIEAAQS